jgi:hypothetical protein
MTTEPVCQHCDDTGIIEFEWGKFDERVGFDYCECPAGIEVENRDRIAWLRLIDETSATAEAPFRHEVHLDISAGDLPDSEPPNRC